MKRLQHPTEPPGAPVRSSGELVAFGGPSAGGTGYMAVSERVGPGVVVVADGGALSPALCACADRLVEEGFTALVVDLVDAEGAEEGARRVGAACAHLVENWHPRTGIVAFGPAGSPATVAGRADLDAAVLYYPGALAVWPGGPLLVHAVDRAEAELQAGLPDAEVFLYEGAAPGFAEPGGPAFDRPAAELAWARTVDHLVYYLS